MADRHKQVYCLVLPEFTLIHGKSLCQGCKWKMACHKCYWTCNCDRLGLWFVYIHRKSDKHQRRRQNDIRSLLSNRQTHSSYLLHTTALGLQADLTKFNIKSNFKKPSDFLCSVDRAALYNLVNITILANKFSEYVYCFSLHVSSIYVPIIRRKYLTYATSGISHSIYRVIQEESALLWEMIVWVILSKKVHTNMSPILNGYGVMGIF